MVGVRVEPPPPPSAAGVTARLAARGVRLRRVSSKRSWPLGCGRFPAPPPPTAVAGDGEKGADEAVTPGSTPPQGQDKVEVAAALVAVSPAVQNGALPQQGQNKAAEAVVPAAVSPVERNDVLQHPLPQLGPEQVEEEGDRGEKGEVGSLFNGTDAASFDGQEGNGTAQVAAPMVGIPESNIVGASSSAHNDDEGAGLFVVEEGHGGSGHVVRDESAGDADGREIGNGPSGGELEGNVDGVEGSRKRWLTSALNPLPKRRLVSAVRRFPPGVKRPTVTTNGNGVLEVSPMGTFPTGCGRAAVPTDGIAVLEVLPIRAYPPDCERAAVTTIGSGDKESMQLGATTISTGDASAIESLAALQDSGGATNEKVEGKRVVEHNRIQESQVASNTSLVYFVGAKQDNDQPPNVITKASPKHGFIEKMKGNISSREGKQVAQAIDANTKGKISDGDKMNAMRKKPSSTKKELTPANAIMKEDKFAHKPKGDDIGKNTSKYGKHVTPNQIEENNDMDLVPDQITVQALMASDKCPWTQGRMSVASASKSLAPRKKLKRKDSPPRKLKGKDSPPRKQLPLKVASCKLANDETIECNEDSYHEDDGSSRALVVYEEKRENRELSVNLPPFVPSSSRSHHEQSGHSDVDARSKVRKLLQKFQGVCRKLMQAKEQRLRNIGRIDTEAMNVLKNDPMYTKPEAIVGNIPGVEVGDEFHFRVELSLVSLHRPYQAGIDTNKVNGVLIAISIVASGGYPDELSSSDKLIYTGSGGKATDKKEAEDQKLLRGNLALKNCIETKTPVRVIHGFKGQSRGEVAHSKGKQVSTFTYDGLYNVVDYWQEGPKGSMVFKYKLLRIPGQPQLSLHEVKVTKKSKIREGLILPDLSHGNESIPICVINTIDSLRPAPFKYVTKIIYPSWYKKESPTGCDCTNGCSDSVKCACVVKNGEIPYNFNGAIVEAKPLIYECGPSCRCPPTCHNRVSQHGIKIPLEIFKTGNTGWGVRSLSSISSGSFICEYAGELLQDKEAEKRGNDEYLFDIGNNYHDKELWEGLKSVPGLKAYLSSSKTLEGFTIDAAECSNVGRFINHSCSPNLYAQNVLWDHDDVEKPHVMFFAMENIPPLQELTYDYHYKIGQVRDKNGEEKVKHCYCGSSECCGRLY